MSNEELADLIADMHISEISLKRHELRLQDSLKDVYLETLEKIHGIGSEKIKLEVEALMEDRPRQSDVYTLVINKLQKLEKELKQKKNPKQEK